MKRLLLIILITALATSCDNSTKESFDLLILNAQVVDVFNNQIIPNQYIGINADTLAQVGDMSRSDIAHSVNLIDANNAFIMPGLWDNHVHFRGGEALIDENKNLLPLYLKYGVTTVRDAGGDITPAILQWKKEMEQGKLVGPYIFTSGPKLDGSKAAWPGSIKVETSEDVIMALDSLEKLGVDYVKMYDGNLSKEAYYLIIEEAEKRDLKTTGHMPLSANIIKAVELGLDGSEHLYYVLKACAANADSLNELEVNYSFMSSIAQSYDSVRAQQVYRNLAEKNVFITLTLYIGSVLGNLLTVDHKADSLLPYIGNGIIDTYQMRIERAKSATNAGSNNRLELAKVFSQMIRPMYDNGVPILAGSDGGAFNSFTYPGESLHGELRQLVQAGLTPQEALITSIINGPKFFDLGDKYGSVEKGKTADLLILAKNPLIDIKHLLDIHYLILKGKPLTSQEIDSTFKNLKD